MINGTKIPAMHSDMENTASSSAAIENPNINPEKTSLSMHENLDCIDTPTPPPYQATADEVYMNPKQRAHFRLLLNQKKQSLLANLGKKKSQFSRSSVVLPDLSDRATQEEAFSLELKARDREYKLTRKIDEALDNIQAGHYGYCNTCGGNIGIQRLEARPMATLCIDCKTLDELKERQQGE